MTGVEELVFPGNSTTHSELSTVYMPAGKAINIPVGWLLGTCQEMGIKVCQCEVAPSRRVKGVSLLEEICKHFLGVLKGCTLNSLRISDKTTYRFFSLMYHIIVVIKKLIMQQANFKMDFLCMYNRSISCES